MELTPAKQFYERIVNLLPANERRRLVEIFVHHLTDQHAEAASPKRRRWRVIRGMVTYPMCGEYAQKWVSRTRHEADEPREIQLRRDP
ncbi:MAG: hypothetical protein HYR55_10705 [Acidobacteria bacterium]|nr:hypothetical protein [Acidobacteriota bacterium]MBI3658051.1 hypothetical protein [Acidobacteriota bacterium]